MPHGTNQLSAGNTLVSFKLKLRVRISSFFYFAWGCPEINFSLATTMG